MPLELTKQMLDDAVEYFIKTYTPTKYLFCGREVYNTIQRLALTKHLRQEWREFYRRYRQYSKTNSAILIYTKGHATILGYTLDGPIFFDFDPAEIRRHNEEVKRKYPLRRDNA